MHPSTLAKRLQFLLFLVIIAFYFYGLGHLPLLGPDEPRYAQVAQEMYLRHDWITPTLGGHTWFEKPALLYWLEIVSFNLFGVSDWSARLGPAVCGVLTIVAIYLLVKEVAANASAHFAEWNVLFAASCLGVIAFSRGASFDIVITMTTAWALCFFLRAELASEPRKQFRLLLGFYCFIGLSLIAKGLVGIVIPAGTLGFYYLLRRELPRRSLWLSLLWGVPVALLVSAIWYGPVIHRHGWLFINEFFVQHHFARYLSNKYHHPQPIYFYPAILLMLSLPWTPLLVNTLIQSRQWNWRGSDSLNRLLVFSFAWILFPLLFFSFSGSKLPGYILPVLPPALVLISTTFVRTDADQSSRWPIKATGALCLIMGIAGFYYGVRIAQLSFLCTTTCAAPFIVAGLFTLLSKRESLSVGVTAGSVFLSIIALLNCGAPNIVRRESTRELLKLASDRGYSNLRVLALPGDDRSAEFYASGRVIYGADGEVLPVYDVPEIVAEARKRGERLLAFVAAQDLYLYQGRTGVEIIGDNGKLAIICLY